MLEKLFNVPYHSWAYDLGWKFKGLLLTLVALITIDHKGFKNSDHGLKLIRIHIWHDWIFINLNGKAKKFGEYAKPLIKKFKDINLGKIKKVATLDFGRDSIRTGSFL